MTDSEWLSCQDYRRLLQILNAMNHPLLPTVLREILIAVRMMNLDNTSFYEEIPGHFGRPRRPFQDRVAFADVASEHRRLILTGQSASDSLLNDFVEAVNVEGYCRAVFGGHEHRIDWPAPMSLDWYDIPNLIREIIGPLTPVDFRPQWLTGDVLALAADIQQGDLFDVMPILADALQEAGCDNDAILNHCRDTVAKHHEHCWVLRLLFDTTPSFADVDPLTGLVGPKKFDAVLAKAVRRAAADSSSLTILDLDIDNFGGINKLVGQFVGDQMLLKFVRLVLEVLGADGFLTRIGGDEFGVILPAFDLPAALQIAEDLQQILKHRSWTSQDGQIFRQQLTVSVGVATLNPGETDSQRMRNAARDALQRAKIEGRNRVCSASELTSQ